ncbi:MAG TPA: hypothetical protein VHQ24_15020 [Lachnospiraceae bacterium]|nr:hypothetical protein [Lachnospiraceae bacterium]
MKKNIATTLLIALLLQGCSSQPRDIPSESKTSFTSSIKMESLAVSVCDIIEKNSSNLKEYPLSIDGAIDYLHEVLGRMEDFHKSDLTIETKQFEDNSYNFLHVSFSSFWCDELYRIDLSKNGTITNLVSCGGGLKETFAYDMIRITQGAFITVYSSSHMGNGTLDFYPLDGDGVPTYSIFAIDMYHECQGATALDYGLTDVYSDDITASTVYKNGKLIPTYQDVDGDGNTDISLTGTLLLYNESIKDTENPDNPFGILVKEIPCNYIYYYNVKTNSFGLE